MRIDLESGRGHIDVVFDGRDGKLVPYDGDEGFHARFGGRTYYVSYSGASCAGWIPGNAGVKKVSTYRVDTHRPWIGRMDGAEVFGRRLMVPVSYRDRGVAEDWPVIDLTEVGPLELGNRGFWGPCANPEASIYPWPREYLKEDLLDGAGERTIQKLRFLSQFEVNELLTGVPLKFEQHEIKFNIVQPEPAGPAELEVVVKFHATSLAWNFSYDARKGLADVIQELIAPAFALETPLTRPPAHWVGIKVKEGYAYQVRRGVPRRAVPVAELCGDGGEKLNEILPDGFRALAADVVVGNGLVLGPDRTKTISPEQELRLLQGVDAPQVAADLLGLPADRPEWDFAEWLAAQAPVGARSSSAPTPVAPATDQPLADWERELLESR